MSVRLDLNQREARLLLLALGDLRTEYELSRSDLADVQAIERILRENAIHETDSLHVQ